MMSQIQMIQFMKNVSMLGGALLIPQFGAGPFSLDARPSRRTRVRGVEWVHGRPETANAESDPSVGRVDQEGSQVPT
jgi:hypothetical protein